MLKRKCKGCAEKIERKFNYCPWCGSAVKGGADMGMLGAGDDGRIQEDLKLPFGVEKIMGGLVKQLEKQLGGMETDPKTGMPKGFKIQIARGPMPGKVVQNKPEMRRKAVVVSREEADRRRALKKVEAKSKVKRLGDVIIYEIEAPGVLKKEDVVVAELETGIEVRVFARDKCYVKVIPLKVEVLGVRAGKDRVYVEMRG